MPSSRSWASDAASGSPPERAAQRRNFGLADLAPAATDAGVTATVVIHTVAEPGETPELLAMAAASSLVAAVVGWVDLTAPAVSDTLRELLERPEGAFLAGIRHPVLSATLAGWPGRRCSAAWPPSRLNHRLDAVTPDELAAVRRILRGFLDL
jgi:predicted TIM-barrel fold metal-dependent hydrolase